MSLSNSQTFNVSMNFDKAIWLLQISVFFYKSGWLSSSGPKILAVGSHCSANFQPILDCFIPNFKLKYGNIATVQTQVFIHCALAWTAAVNLVKILVLCESSTLPLYITSKKSSQLASPITLKFVKVELEI